MEKQRFVLQQPYPRTPPTERSWCPASVVRLWSCRLTQNATCRMYLVPGTISNGSTPAPVYLWTTMPGPWMSKRGGDFSLYTAAARSSSPTTALESLGLCTYRNLPFDSDIAVAHARLRRKIFSNEYSCEKWLSWWMVGEPRWSRSGKPFCPKNSPYRIIRNHSNATLDHYTHRIYSTYPNEWATSS